MAWEKPTKELEDIIEQAMEKYDTTMKRMFGSRMFFVNNNMWTGVHRDTLITRLGEEDRGEIIRTFQEVDMFEPNPGQILSEYVQIPGTLVRDEQFLAEWLDRSHAFMVSLPPKPPRKKKHTKKKDKQEK